MGAMAFHLNMRESITYAVAVLLTQVSPKPFGPKKTPNPETLETSRAPRHKPYKASKLLPRTLDPSKPLRHNILKGIGLESSLKANLLMLIRLHILQGVHSPQIEDPNISHEIIEIDGTPPPITLQKVRNGS